MKAKYFIGLLPALILAAGIAFAQQPAPPAAPEPPDEPFDHNFSFFINGDGFLGVYAENINRENMSQYRVGQVRGVGVTQIVKDSPAEKAGLRKDDVILRIDGENITSVRKLNRIVSELSPDQSVRIAVSRGGVEQEVTATIGKRSNSSFAGDLMGGEPRVWKFNRTPPRTFKFEGPVIGPEFSDNFGDFTFMLGSNRRIGVSTTQLTKQLAEYFGIAGGNGVLVTQVNADSPAAKAGIKAGDVITAVDGEPIDSAGELARVINQKKEGDVTLTVIRNKAQQTIRVTPTEGSTPGQPQAGRRIVIPRVEIPMPEIEVVMPRIVIPSIPMVNIKLPSIRVTTPRVRVIKSDRGPI